MLKENPQNRPNIYEVLKDACRMRGKEVPVKDVSRPSSFTLATANDCGSPAVDLHGTIAIGVAALPATPGLSNDRNSKGGSDIFSAHAGDPDTPGSQHPARTERTTAENSFAAQLC
jgi:AP2-associated kinase